MISPHVQIGPTTTTLENWFNIFFERGETETLLDFMLAIWLTIQTGEEQKFSGDIELWERLWRYQHNQMLWKSISGLAKDIQ